MSDTDSGRQSDEGAFAVDENPSNAAVPYGGETGADDGAATSDTIVGPPGAESNRSGVPTAERTTAPQSSYTLRHVAVGAAVTLAGVLVAFVLPVLLL